MKKITLFLMLLVASASYSQIKRITLPNRTEIGKITPGGILAMECEKMEDTYYFTYKDIKFTAIDERKIFRIKDVDNAFETLYAILIEGFDTMPSEPIILEFPEGYLYLDYEKMVGMPIVSFRHVTSKTEYAAIGVSQQFTKKQIDRLFGKSKKE